MIDFSNFYQLIAKGPLSHWLETLPAQVAILDVGCGGGYHMWRMIGAGASGGRYRRSCSYASLKRYANSSATISAQLFLCQFEAVRKLIGNDQRAHLLPLGIEQLPALEAFDTVFSMGVLYHRRSPLDHLWQLKDQFPGGRAGTGDAGH